MQTTLRSDECHCREGNAMKKATHLKAAVDVTPVLSPHPQLVLDRAIETLRIELGPIVSISRRRAFAYEARLRCEEPMLESAAHLLRATTVFGRRTEVGRRVRTLAAAAVDLAPTPFLFTPVDSADLLDSDLYDPASRLARVARRVVLMLADQVTLEDILDLDGRLADLRRLGFRLAIDGIGAGPSGLAGCAVLSPDFVRLDPSLLQGIHRSASRRLLVRGLCGMFHHLGTMVIATGVESPAECDIVAALGCDLAQGALFKTMAPAHAAAGRLA